jgi:hypothetical protein
MSSHGTEKENNGAFRQELKFRRLIPELLKRITGKVGSGKHQRNVYTAHVF